MVKREPPRFLFNCIPDQAAQGSRRFAAARRSGSPPGRPASGAAFSPCRSRFPRRTCRPARCCRACRCPTSAARWARSSYFATDLSRYEEGNTEWAASSSTWPSTATRRTSELVGPPNPIVAQEDSGHPRQGRPAERSRTERRSPNSKPRKTSSCRSRSRGRAATAPRRSSWPGRRCRSKPASGASGSTSTSTSTSSCGCTA